MNILPSECDCIICSEMCEAPCCGTPEDIELLIDKGYASRLMIDEWPDAETLIKPALKGYEGESAPWETRTARGCTFWKKGKCELHKKKLKPIQGQLAHHSYTKEQHNSIAEMINESWKTDKAKEVIEKWKQMTTN